MARTQFYKAVKPARLTQGPRGKGKSPRVILSKEAKALLRGKQKSARERYHSDLEGARVLIDRSAAMIAETHRKSFSRVLLELHTGRRNISRSTHNKSNPWNAYTSKVAKELKLGMDWCLF